MKKFLLSFTIIGAIVFSIATLSPINTFARPDGTCDGLTGQELKDCQKAERAGSSTNTNTTTQNSSSNAGSSNFFGLTPWNYGVPDQISSEEGLKNSIWQIAANIATDIVVIAAYLVLGYVIYGGYMYIFSAGDPGKAATGKKTLVQAFIGLAIVMSANLIMGTIRAVLVGGQFKDCVNSTSPCVDANTMIEQTITWFISMSGIVAVIFLIYGGIQYITSAGDASKLDKAKKMITYSLIGLLIVALSIAITAFVSNMIRDAQSTIELIKIAKGN